MTLLTSVKFCKCASAGSNNGLIVSTVSNLVAISIGRFRIPSSIYDVA